MANGKAFLRIDQLTKRYGAVTVLDMVSLTVEEGEFLTVLGPSGSGKTTILRMIGGFTEPDEGRILFGGEDVTGQPIHKRPFNTVFQDYALFPHMTVGQNVAYGLMVRGVDKGEIATRGAESLAMVALEGYEERYPAQLSGGQQQRVALARALICQPRLILLDEPLAALDAALRRQMRTFLKSLQQDLGITFVFITHDQEEAIAMSDRICVIDKGKIEQIGTPHDIYYRPETLFVATFFGDNNLFDGRRLNDGSARNSIETRCGTIAVRDRQLVAENDHGVVIVAVRPEAMRVAGESADVGDNNSLTGQVKSVEFVGPMSHIWVVPEQAPGSPILLKQQNLAGVNTVNPGETVTLAWRPEDCAVIPQS